MPSVAEVNGDGYADLVVYLRTKKPHLTFVDIEAVLYAETYSGEAIRSSDKVRVIDPGPPALKSGRADAAHLIAP